MAKVYLTKEDERKARLKKIIRDAIYENDTNKAATADSAGVKRHILYDILNQHAETIKLRDLWRILDELKVPPEERAKILV